jgi:N-acetylmuramoyl-L-alanine amidase
LKRNLICGASLAILIAQQGVANEYNEYKVAIDVGHSRARPGAISAYGKSEFGFNLALAKSVYDALSAHGLRALQIGHEGNSTDLENRTRIANHAGAKFFLSIHHDSVQPQFLKPWHWQGETHRYSDHASGFSLFISRKNPFPAASLDCAAAIGRALKQTGLQKSSHHAEPIFGESKEWADEKNGVYYYDDLVVLKTAKMPAVLLEAGVIVNREEEHRLETAEMRNLIATAVHAGLLNCNVLAIKSDR